MPDWRTFQVASTVVHYVETTRDTATPTLLLTSETIDLDAELTAYFADKVTDRLEKKGLAVLRDPDQTSTPVPDAVVLSLADADQLVTTSKTIAQHLFNIQSGSNSSGLIAVISGTIGHQPQPCLAIVKLERQRGVSFEIDPGSGTVDLELLRNLTLTDKTKVYKTALFTGIDPLGGWVADDQRTAAKGRQVATFFLGRFLGCKPRDPAADLTYAFVKNANAAINTVVEAPEARGRYQVGLLSVMQDNSTDIRPATFAATHLDEQHRGPFLGALEQAGIDPNATFEKDTSRVAVSEFKMTFASGMVLVGPPESLESNVEIPAEAGPEHPVELRDTVSSIITGR